MKPSINKMIIDGWYSATATDEEINFTDAIEFETTLSRTLNKFGYDSPSTMAEYTILEIMEEIIIDEVIKHGSDIDFSNVIKLKDGWQCISITTGVETENFLVGPGVDIDQI